MKGLSGDSESILDGREASSVEGARACSACGARARRPEARFCATCGRVLGVGYFPTDSLRASYRFERAPSQHRQAAASSRSSRRVFARVRTARAGREFMPRRREGAASSTAFAFVTYALVPYLGILFCPGALLFGGVGLVRAWRSPQTGHTARASAMSIVLGLVILCAQLLLWWILYKVPEWARQAPF